MSWQPREDLLHKILRHASKEEKQGGLRRALSNCIVTTPEDGAKLALEMFWFFGQSVLVTLEVRVLK